MLYVVFGDFLLVVFFFKQKTAYEMRISDWSSDVCSSDLVQSKCRTPSFSSCRRAELQGWPAPRSINRPKKLLSYKGSFGMALRITKAPSCTNLRWPKCTTP